MRGVRKSFHWKGTSTAVAHKADIFHHPVAFNPNELTQAADGHEALVASLNKYAAVDLEYMAGLTWRDKR